MPPKLPSALLNEVAASSTENREVVHNTPIYPIAVVDFAKPEVPQWQYPDIPLQAVTIQQGAALQILDHEEVARRAQIGTTINICEYYDRWHEHLYQTRVESLRQEHAFQIDGFNHHSEGLVRWIEDDRRLIEAGRDREQRLLGILDENKLALNTARDEVDTKNKELAKKQVEATDLESKVSGANAELEEKQIEVAALESKVSSANIELVTEQEQTRVVTAANEQLQLKITGLEMQLQDERKQIDLQADDFQKAKQKSNGDLKRCELALQEQKAFLLASRGQLDDARMAKEQSEREHKRIVDDKISAFWDQQAILQEVRKERGEISVKKRELEREAVSALAEKLKLEASNKALKIELDVQKACNERVVTHVQKVRAATRDLAIEAKNTHDDHDECIVEFSTNVKGETGRLQEPESSACAESLSKPNQPPSLPRQIGSESMDSGYESAKGHRDSVAEDGEIAEKGETREIIEEHEIAETQTETVQLLSPASPRSSIGNVETPSPDQLGGQNDRGAVKDTQTTPRKVSLQLRSAVETKSSSHQLSGGRTASDHGGERNSRGPLSPVKRQQEESESDSDVPIKCSRRER